MQNLAFILIGIGVLILAGWGAWGLLVAADIPLVIKIALGAIGVGTLFLIIIAIKDRMTRAKKEDFEEIER